MSGRFNTDSRHRSPSSPLALDETDRSILALLAADARLSVREIARRVQMSPGATADRINRLEAGGAIVGYHAQISPSALGYGLRAIIALQTAQGPSLDETFAGLMKIPEVEAVHVVTGTWDLVALVRVRDHEHLREVVLDRIWKIPSFRHSETMIVYETRERPGGWNVGLALQQVELAEPLDGHG